MNWHTANCAALRPSKIDPATGSSLPLSAALTISASGMPSGNVRFTQSARPRTFHSLTSASRAQVSEWNVRGLADWVNLTFPLGMPEAEIVKAADSGKDEPVAGSIFDGLSAAQFAV